MAKFIWRRKIQYDVVNFMLKRILIDTVEYNTLTLNIKQLTVIDESMNDYRQFLTVTYAILNGLVGFNSKNCQF
jgi:hypothetical protein